MECFKLYQNKKLKPKKPSLWKKRKLLERKKHQSLILLSKKNSRTRKTSKLLLEAGVSRRSPNFTTLIILTLGSQL